MWTNRDWKYKYLKWTVALLHVYGFYEDPYY